MEPLVVVTRNDYIESIHYGYICITDCSGKVLYNLGDYNTRIFFRSSAKPIQVLPLIKAGAAEAFHFSLRDIAIACASHSGQKIHQLTVREILSKLDLGEAALHCGTMTPYNEDERKRLLIEGKASSQLHCSCSGKHSAMLALAKFKNYDLDKYEKADHPVQQEILKTIAEFADEDVNSISLGTDGCGVPIYLLPIYKIALSYAKLVGYMQDGSHPYHLPCKTIFDAMNQYPEMVAGEYEFCTELLQATKGKLIGKVGCEAVYCLGIKDKNIGICIKIIDGNTRAIYPVVIQLLREMDVLNESEFSKLKHWYMPILKNNLDEPIGKIIPVLSMKKSLSNMPLLGKKIRELE